MSIYYTRQRKTLFPLHVQVQLTESQSYLIKCINPKCQLYIDPDFLTSLIKNDPKSMNLYNKKLINSIVESNPQCIWCCSPKCESVVWVANRGRAKEFRNYFLNTEICKDIAEMERNQEKGVVSNLVNEEMSETSCSSSKNTKNTKSSKNVKSYGLPKQPIRQKATQPIFNPEKLKIDCQFCNIDLCFNCSKPWHDPVTCEYLAKWEKKCTDDSETLKWLAINTKPCPKCHVNIEKNSGCNHMVCSQPECKYSFCWMCMEDWEKHGNSWYKCDKVAKLPKDASKEAEMQTMKDSSEKYLKCYERYIGHQNSLKFELNTQKQVNNKMVSIQDDLGVSYIETQFLEKSAKTLVACRRTLMFCYVFSYYLADNEQDNNSEIFCENLNDLHVAVERLSKLFDDISADNTNTIYHSGKDKDGKIMDPQKYKSSSKNKKSKQKDLASLKNSSLGSSSSKADNLAELLQKYKCTKIEILNYDRYCLDRREKLLSHVREGYEGDDMISSTFWTFWRD